MALVDELKSDLHAYYVTHAKSIGLINPRYESDSNTLTWRGHQTSRPVETYEEYFEWAQSNGQYSIGLEDGSLVRFFYQTEKRKLIKASIAFLPSEICLDERLCNYFRVDCDFIAAKDYHHSHYHIHFGYNNEMRVSLHRFPVPSVFLDFLMLTVYKKEERRGSASNKHILNLDELGSKYHHIFRFT